ncbi:hypothetical protein HZS_4587 [Henneguya salminicola]|nr:hypothetical protein HZS_4587 [Henneguya salminicola]
MGFFYLLIRKTLSLCPPIELAKPYMITSSLLALYSVIIFSRFASQDIFGSFFQFNPVSSAL